MLPVQITVKDMPSSPALEDHIRKKALKLNQYCPRITRLRVVIHVPQKHKHQGKLFSIHIDLTVPGRELVVNRKLDEDIYIAIRNAFIALQRQLESYYCKRQGQIKTHDLTCRGTIKFLNGEFGFIQGYDGNEYYFSPANFCNKRCFDQLQQGDIVEFIATMANDGLQANRITLLKNHNHAA